MPGLRGKEKRKSFARIDKEGIMTAIVAVAVVEGISSGNKIR